MAPELYEQIVPYEKAYFQQCSEEFVRLEVATGGINPNNIDSIVSQSLEFCDPYREQLQTFMVEELHFTAPYADGYSEGLRLKMQKSAEKFAADKLDK